jgi:hypothetical protein
MRCRGLHRLAKPAYLSWFLCSASPCVAPYCVPGGVRAVSGVRGLRVTCSSVLDTRVGMGPGCPQPVEFTLAYFRHLHYSGNIHLSINVEPRAFEPLTSAVQNQGTIIARVCSCPKIPAKQPICLYDASRLLWVCVWLFLFISFLPWITAAPPYAERTTFCPRACRRR